MYTIRDLCKISKLSRSTILYYDSLGLLKPAERSASNYRLYSDESIKTLNKICLYREAGVSLSDIGMLTDMPENDDIYIDILEKTLILLNNQAHKVQEKQKMIIDMIKTIKDNDNTEDAFDEEYDARRKRIAQFAFDIHDYVGISEEDE